MKRIRHPRGHHGVIVPVLGFCLFLLSGCSGRRNQAARERSEALKYYKNKYSLTGAEIVSSKRAGNSGLFGYAGVKSTAYEMNDGEWVLWDNDAQKYSDTRQAKEIRDVFEKEILAPCLARLTVPFSVSDPDLNRTNMDSFDEYVFRERFDGDIREFCRKEKPAFSEFRIVLETEDSASAEAEVRDVFEELKEYVSGYGTAVMTVPGYPEDGGYFINDPGISAIGNMRFGDDQLCWYRQIYASVGENVLMMGNEPDLVLAEGDLVLEAGGSLSELQQILDKAYYSLPKDAPENQKGGYQVHDQRHERRAVLDETEGVFYRVRFSERVRTAAGEDGRLSVYIRTVNKDGRQLMMYPDKGWSVYPVCTAEDEKGKFQSITDGQIFFYGSVHTEAFPE